MSKTTTINPATSGSNSSNRKQQAAAFTATAATAAGLGVAGANLVSEVGEEEIITNADNIIIDEVSEEATNSSDAVSNLGVNPASSTHSPEVSTASSTSTVEPQPLTEADIIEPSATIDPAVDAPTTVEPEVAVETESIGHASTSTSDIVNPDEIAEAIIAEDRIDPNDIDMADVVNFDEIGTVYTVDGESYTAAAFHDAAGNDLIMIDVDGDNVFDVITDYDGNYVADVPVNLSVGDAQEDIADDDVYLAYDNEMDNVDEYGDDTLADDLMA